ncbi:MAG: DUF1801 domain-containing protein [Bacteroidia bacterium]|nr:DUF1801 domain-containing protein [Bacteroidia bacterium]
MAELKTRPTEVDVHAFLESIPDAARREDCKVLYALMKNATGLEGCMWGDSIVGFGTYHYVYDSGREGDWFLTGFSPRKQNLTLYIMSGFRNYQDLLKGLGPCKTGSSCLYVKRLSDIDQSILTRMIDDSIRYLRKKYGG